MIVKHLAHIGQALRSGNKVFISKLIFNIFLLGVIVASIYTAFAIALVDRSLYLDEAMTAYSLSLRSLNDLTSEIFDWHQPAPVIYLYIVKLITLIFGNTEFTLRIWSLVMYVSMLGCSYYISKSVLKVKFPLLATAFLANLTFLITMSNVFKAYMSDCFSVSFTLIIYHLYKERKLGKIAFTAIFSLLVWYSNPACFFMGTILAYEFVESLLKKDYTSTKYIIICGLAVSISFLIYYFYWLKPEIDTGFMAEFWKDNKFPLIPTSMNDVALARVATHHICSYMSAYNQLILWVVVAGGIISFFIERNRYTHIMYIGVLVCLLASMLGYYPIQDRLWLFIYPLFAILFFYYLNKLYSGNLISGIVVSVLSVIIVLSGNGISHYSDRQKIINPSEEINPAIDYVGAKIKENEKLFVYYPGIAGFCYRNNFDKTSFAGFDNNVVLGTELYVGETDTEAIVNNAPIYVLIIHPPRLADLIGTLRERGTLDLVFDENNTHVYYYKNKE